MKEIDVPVLVIGAGPIGLLAGHMFEQRGIKTLIAERYQGRLDAPKAHAPLYDPNRGNRIWTQGDAQQPLGETNSPRVGNETLVTDALLHLG